MSTIIIITIIGLIIFLVFCSSLFSFSEMALANINRIRLKTIIKSEKNKRKRKNAKLILKLRENYNQTSTSIVIANNIVNILATTLAATFFNELFDNNIGILISTIIMTILIVTFGEITPKLLARKYPESGSILLAKLIYGTYIIFVPITKIIEKVVKQEKEVIFKNEEELSLAIDEGNQEGIIDKDEKIIIQGALDFDKDKINTIMEPLKNVFYIKNDISNEELEQVLVENRYSRIPVIDEKNNVMGVLNIKNFLINKTNSEYDKLFLNGALTEPIFLDKDEVAKNAFNKLRQERKSMAIIVDDIDNKEENKKMIGILTIEDLLEEIVGEIYDENDIEADGIYELGLNTIEINYWTNAKAVFEEYFKDLKIIVENDDINFGDWVYNTFNIKYTQKEEFFENENYFHYENILIWVKRKSNITDTTFEIDIIE